MLCEKTCDVCLRIFVIEYQVNGSGSANVYIKRKYCSKQCKKLASKRGDLGNRIQKFCLLYRIKRNEKIRE